VSLALIGKATDFDGRFDAFTIVLCSILLLVGTLTLLRVYNGSEEDQAYVIGMNRLRAAYAELDPGIERYFVTSTHDDDRGVLRVPPPAPPDHPRVRRVAAESPHVHETA
jgi:hypothetical protein